MSLSTGEVLGGRFELVGELGRGGTATVWLARDRVRDEAVALKVVHPHLADQPAVAARLRREVQASSKVRHEGALVAHELHEADGHLLLCMPLHRGTTLAEHVRRHGPWTADALEALGRRLAGVLSAAHRNGVVHRDVTPNNVMVDDDGTAVLTDFGLARLVERHTATSTSVMGTPGFAAPEVYDGTPTDPRSDLYSLGAVLYLAATGAPPFDASSPVAALRRQLDGGHLPLAKARPDLPSRLSATVDALLRPSPDERPQTAREVEDLLSGRMPPRDAVRVAPSPPPADASAPAVREHLPPGDYRVVVRERGQDAHRRERVRRRRARRRDPVTSTVDNLLSVALEQFVDPALQQVLGTRRGVPPEQILAEAVSRSAGLPHDALVVPVAALQKRFRLVDGVDEAVAHQLALEAREAGFKADVRRGAKASNPMPWGVFLMAFALPAFIILVASKTWLPALILLAVGTFVKLASHEDAARKQRRPDDHREPLAYGRDLRPHLRREYQDLLGPPPNGVVNPPQASPPPPLPAPTPKPVAAKPPETLRDQVQSRIARLQADVEASDALPSAVQADLGAAVKAMATQADRLAEHLARIEAEIARSGVSEVVEQEVARVQARLTRLDTLARAGTEVDPGELSRLRGVLDGHLADLAHAELLEQQRLELTSRLLEVGTAANEARRDLFDVTTPSQPLTDVLTRLHAEVAAANDARHEVDGLEQARRAAASRNAQRG